MFYFNKPKWDNKTGAIKGLLKNKWGEEEKRRILNLHEGFKNRVLTEQHITKNKILNEAPDSYLQQVKMITDRSTIDEIDDPGYAEEDPI